MTITFTDNEITTTASEQDLFDITSNKVFSTYIFLDLMASGDTVVIRVFVLDGQDSTMRKIYEDTISGAQDPPTFFVVPLTTSQYKVTIQRTLGTDRLVSWRRVEVS